MDVLIPHAPAWATGADHAPSLGSIGWLDLHGPAIDALRAIEFAVSRPWVPLLVAGPALAVQAFRLRTPAPDLVLHAPGPRPAPADARRHLAHSPAPPARSLAGWVAGRCLVPTAKPLLAAMMDDSVRAPWAAVGCSRREFYRRAASLGPLRPGDWRRLSLLARQGMRSDLTVEHLASNVGVGFKALRRQVASLVGGAMAEYRTNPGWSWVLESALRRHGIIAAPDRDRLPRVAGSSCPERLGPVELLSRGGAPAASRGAEPRQRLPVQR